MGILVTGTVALDTVQTPFGEMREGLGGSATHFSVAASFFTEVALVAVVGKDFPEQHLDFLKSRGINLEGLEKSSGETFRWTGRYGNDLNSAQTLETKLNVLASFKPKLPDSYRDAKYVFLANVDPDIQQKVIEAVRAPKLIACDTMNFWIEGKRDSLIKTLSQVDILLINDGEARQLAQESNLVRAAAKIRALGPRTLIIKQGEYGALLFFEKHIFSAPGYPLEDIKDPTGAGDSFAGGFMGFLAKTGQQDLDTLKQAVIIGSVMASYNVEAFSCDRLRTLTEQEIFDRYRAFRHLSDFKEIM